MKRLLDDGHEVAVSLPDGPFVPKLRELGCRITETPLDRRGKNPLAELKLMRRYGGLIRTVGPGAVLTYTIKPNIYGGLVCRLRGIPYIANITGLGASLENGGILRAVTVRLYRAALRKASRVFFQNRENLEFMERRRIVTRQERRLIPGSGVNTEQFAPLPYPAEDDIHFLFIGRIIREKGIDEYLEAAEAIKANYPRTVFHILGSCEESYEQKLTALQERGVIVYHGLADDVREWLRIAHCTIHPSWWEGMSNVLLESASCARPVIASDISGCREIVDHGVTGYLFERQNSRSLIDAIERFLALRSGERETMGLEGRKKIEREFDRGIVVDAYATALAEIEAQRAAGTGAH